MSHIIEPKVIYYYRNETIFSKKFDKAETCFLTKAYLGDNLVYSPDKDTNFVCFELPNNDGRKKFIVSGTDHVGNRFSKEFYCQDPGVTTQLRHSFYSVTSITSDGPTKGFVKCSKLNEKVETVWFKNPYFPKRANVTVMYNLNPFTTIECYATLEENIDILKPVGEEINPDFLAGCVFDLTKNFIHDPHNRSTIRLTLQKDNMYCTALKFMIHSKRPDNDIPAACVQLVWSTND